MTIILNIKRYAGCYVSFMYLYVNITNLKDFVLAEEIV